MITNKQIEKVATMLAAAYWRGWFKTKGLDGAMLEDLISAAAKADMPRWMAAARMALA